MILKKLTIENYGPFAVPTEIEIDPEVTILTGQNDVGKTSILRLIQLMCEGNQVSEDDVNIERTYPTESAWRQDDGIKCVAEFFVTNKTASFVGLTGLNDITVEFQLATRRKQVVSITRNESNLNPNNVTVKRMPDVLFLPLKQSIPSTISLTTINTIEQDFLELAFGKNYKEVLNNHSTQRLRRQIRDANKRINEVLEDVYSTVMGLKLVIQLATTSETVNFDVSIEDTFDSYTPINYRGSGIQRLTELMISLSILETHKQPDYLYILLDEPENSLHADSQHRLRRFLEKIAKNHNIQVIYATHSPSMINSFNPKGVRLLERTSIDGKPTSTVNNKPYENNFQPVRVQLGITPADSLLYAPITIVTEGETERKCLPILLRELQEKVKEFRNIDELFSLTHIIDGQGNNFELWCRLAESQGAKTVIYIDGDEDKLQRIAKPEFRNQYPDVPVIHLPKGQEFEEIVPEGIYFTALREILGDDSITSENWQQWVEKNEKQSFKFSKRIEIWLRATTSYAYNKPETMQKAIEIANLDEIDLSSIRELIKGIDKTLKRL